MGACMKKQNKNVRVSQDIPTIESPWRRRSASLNPLRDVFLQKNIHLDYEFIRVLGHGKYGNVNYAKSKDPLIKQEYAVKSLIKAMIEDKMNVIHRELEILLSVDHPNIVKFFYAYEDPKFIHIVTEYCSGGDLLSKLCEVGTFSETETAIIIKNLLGALNYLHSMGICHRDIKLDNILLASEGSLSDIKLIDFDFAKRIDTSLLDMNTVVGTLHFIAPEVFDRICGTPADIWSLGIVMYVLLVGKPPFRAESESEILGQIKSRTLDLNDKEYRRISSAGKDLLSKLLDFDYNTRITAENALKHPWFISINQKSNFYNNERILKRLKQYQVKGRLKKEIMKIIVKVLDTDEIQHLKEVFEHLDLDHNGYITLEELKQGLNAVGITDSSEIERIFDVLNDTEAKINGGIRYSDFLAATLNRKAALTESTLWAAFKYFDHDNSGKITPSNIYLALKRTGVDIPAEEMEKMLKEEGISTSHKIDFADFKKIVMPAETFIKKKSLQSKKGAGPAIGDNGVGLSYM
ncbi:unnamed protein product [Blepharisma stoltei]|uniref:Calcium-dependent protein kinase n=1 Tax=Blepharisma stoltei TaxID=1481888 RepID=A0AAU9J5N6_9CILI|nr:unnamed protein product [Blepharisma stoltei]